jgi:hypothetical protein
LDLQFLRTEIPRRKPSDFRGPSWGNRSCVPLCFSNPEGPDRPRRARGNFLFRRLLPTDPISAPKSFNIACRRRSVLLSLPRPSHRCRFSGETGTSAPITKRQCSSPPSRESEKRRELAVDNGDIGNNPHGPPEAAIRLPEAAPAPTSAKCLNPLPRPRNPPI